MKDLGFFNRRKYEEKGKRIFYCRDCNKEHMENLNNLKEKVQKVTDIMEELGFYEMSDNDSGVLYNKPNLIYFEIDKKGTKLTFDMIMGRLKGKEINEGNIEEVIEYEKEIAKVKMREKKFKLREKVEKEVYGKIKTKRQIFDNGLKESIYSRYNNECTVCGGKEGLHIHHKDKNPKDNKMNNLTLLCGVCHKKVHMKVR